MEPRGLFWWFCGKTQKEIRSGRKGREEWSICRQWFSVCSVYHVIVELILWFQCPAQWEFWQNKAVTHNKLNWDFLVIQKDGSETFSYWLHVQASHRKSLTLALSHHVGWQIVLPCIREVFPSIHVMLGTCFFFQPLKRKEKKKQKNWERFKFCLSLWMR